MPTQTIASSPSGSVWAATSGAAMAAPREFSASRCHAGRDAPAVRCPSLVESIGSDTEGATAASALVMAGRLRVQRGHRRRGIHLAHAVDGLAGARKEVMDR